MSVHTLFAPIQLGAIPLPHRIVMAPLTRMRADRNGVPGPLNAEYYAQRATAALIITEATAMSIQGRGIPHMPEIHTRAQIEGWRGVVASVHAQGGRIVLQIVHNGRASHVAYMPDGRLPVGPSAIPIVGKVYMPDFSFADYQTPRALLIEEIPAIIEEFRQAALNAMEAGFDGVELHGANGYLLNQFLEDGSNQRTDRYGGSYENRSRLLLEVVEAVKGAIGAERLGVRLSPYGTASGMSDGNPLELYSFTISQLNGRGLAYLHLIEGRASGLGRTDVMRVDALNNAELFGHLFDGPVISAGGYTPETANAAIEAGHAAAIAFGRLFISNPDLVSRIGTHAALNPYDRKTFYGGGAHGYTDYPSLDIAPVNETRKVHHVQEVSL
jgi:N-ethylmaleimide reductase